MRGVLVVNPVATTTTLGSRDVLVRALSSDIELTVAYTQQRGHAWELARQAAEDGYDLVLAMGGDGTVNEAVNGLMAARLAGSSDEPAARRRPLFAVVPGGSTNVFARALGLPNGWAEATSVILEALRSGRSRTIGLGRADERYFTFCAGLGLDAAVIRRVEQARQRGRRSTPALYLRSALKQFVLGPVDLRPAIGLERPGTPAEGPLAMVIVQNTAPWTYLGKRPVQANPHASFDRGLDVLGMRRLRPASTLRTGMQFLSRRPDPRGRQVLRLHDLTEFTLVCAEPRAFQLDGDYLGERERVRFVAVPNALRVIC
ncbi:MAG TPA: diacylglycerol kinase family protein [Micromonosporaceae bacterium]